MNFRTFNLIFCFVLLLLSFFNVVRGIEYERVDIYDGVSNLTVENNTVVENIAVNYSDPLVYVTEINTTGFEDKMGVLLLNYTNYVDTRPNIYIYYYDGVEHLITSSSFYSVTSGVYDVDFQFNSSVTKIIVKVGAYPYQDRGTTNITISNLSFYEYPEGQCCNINDVVFLSGSAIFLVTFNSNAQIPSEYGAYSGDIYIYGSVYNFKVLPSYRFYVLTPSEIVSSTSTVTPTVAPTSISSPSGSQNYSYQDMNISGSGSDTINQSLNSYNVSEKTNIISSVASPVFSGLPSKIVAMGAYALLLSVSYFIIKGRK